MAFGLVAVLVWKNSTIILWVREYVAVGKSLRTGRSFGVLISISYVNVKL